MLRKEGVELLLQLDGQGIAAGEYSPQAAQVGPVEVTVAGDGLEERGDAGDEVRPGPADELGVALHVEAGHQDGGAADEQRRMDADAQAETVEHGHCRQHLAMVHFLVRHVGSLPGQGVEIKVA